jgi:hypothetical protein
MSFNSRISVSFAFLLTAIFAALIAFSLLSSKGLPSFYNVKRKQ